MLVQWIEGHSKGLGLCLMISAPCWGLGQAFPIVGGPIFAILLGMALRPLFSRNHSIHSLQLGINFASKQLLKYAVVLLGFGLNLSTILETGKLSLPIIVTTIAAALFVAYLIYRWTPASAMSTTLIGVGSSICGGSAIAATASVTRADDQEVAQAISVVFFFNVIAALTFPTLGLLVGFDTTSAEAFAIFVGTAVNDTSSVTATAATWDTLYHLGTQTLDQSVTVKLTRTLAIIPITLFLAWKYTQTHDSTRRIDFKKIFPTFILFFLFASLITTMSIGMGATPEIFTPFKVMSKFLIILAMSAIGLNTNLIKLIKSGGWPILIGLSCWLSVTLTSLLMQHLLKIW